MADHYYSQKPDSESRPLFWDFSLRGHLLHFQTDQGVFSKKEVDYGSRVLAECVQMPDLKGPVLDMGCGYGPIGLALAKSFPDRTIHMVDLNKRAIELARKNAEKNHIGNTEIYESNIFENVRTDDFALIVTNPPIRAGKKVVHRIFEESCRHLAGNGELWVVIQKKQGAPSARKKMEELFKEVDLIGKDKGYYVFRGKKS
ncbi:class I SAM-dependent methyltransferase [Heyndrickxia acidiproducens]|uniref:class I SAM-dependent methyltransferase n=1 Tax=Heyndrickxia acidiproducens TaxID=1121084 RepID=UPI00037E59C9|nr:class I SAM-dependent methyltransferase [Heyndrickxia acidiproducens]